MISPVSSAAPAPTLAGRPEGSPSQPQAAPPAEATARPAPPPEPKPLSLDVAKGSDGVFVYTLSDPGSGVVLAVIPRQDVQAGRDGRNLDERV